MDTLLHLVWNALAAVMSFQQLSAIDYLSVQYKQLSEDDYGLQLDSLSKLSRCECFYYTTSDNPALAINGLSDNATYR
ncbi:hypothetical protein HD806DRAFT_429148 [Xylariaceae sp. AK1471]|nr:hypothetical protein HD806DRAFT_429148 [Xylariaceae sp. AK1471]